MSQFSVIMKRPLKSADAISAMQAVPRIFIFEQTADNTVYLWPTQRTFTSSHPLNPSDPTDKELLRTGEFITYGGYYCNVSDYLTRNRLPEEQFFIFYLGVFEDVREARAALQHLKALL